jgi:catechol 2,3-dioxygenase
MPADHRGVEKMTATKASIPMGVNHLVLNVRDIEASHHFYTEVLGYEQVGTLSGPMAATMTMRFYSTRGKHHDIALVEQSEPDESTGGWDVSGSSGRINHIAIGYPDRESFMNQIRHLQACGVEFKMRGNHGMTHSAYVSDPDGNGIEVLYEISPEFWQGDVAAALNYFEPMPLDGPESLEDSTAYARFDRE